MSWHSIHPDYRLLADIQQWVIVHETVLRVVVAAVALLATTVKKKVTVPANARMPRLKNVEIVTRSVIIHANAPSPEIIRESSATTASRVGSECFDVI